MATGGENFNPAYETFRKYSADLLKVIQDPEVLVWELFSKCVVTSAVVEFANNITHERGTRTSNLLMAVGSQIAVDPRAFDVFLTVLDKRPSMSDLCGRMKDVYGKSPAPYSGERKIKKRSLKSYIDLKRVSSGMIHGRTCTHTLVSFTDTHRL